MYKHKLFEFVEKALLKERKSLNFDVRLTTEDESSLLVYANYIREKLIDLEYDYGAAAISYTTSVKRSIETVIDHIKKGTISKMLAVQLLDNLAGKCRDAIVRFRSHDI